VTSGPPDFFIWYALGAGLVLALAVVAIGVARVVFAVLALRKRLEALKKLPFEPALQAAQAKVAKASGRMETAPALIARAQRAVADLGKARESATQTALGARDVAMEFFTPR
jgi:hypothetical protein